MANTRSCKRSAEQEFAALNDKLESSRLRDADDWDNAVLDSALDFARFREARDDAISLSVDCDAI